MTNFTDITSADTALHFIRCYRRLEQMPLEDGFAELRCVATSDDKKEEQRLRNHFRAHWYSKERAFGRFYLNLPHYRQIYLLHQWDIKNYEDAMYLLECSRDSRFALMGPPPATTRQLHELVKFFENHSIGHEPSSDVFLSDLPDDSDKRFGNSANWGDYVLSLPDPQAVLLQLLNRVDR